MQAYCALFNARVRCVIVSQSLRDIRGTFNNAAYLLRVAEEAQNKLAVHTVLSLSLFLSTRCQFVFRLRSQIFRRGRRERAINRRPEKLMNNARRHESGHSRRRPMVAIYFRVPASRRTESPPPLRLDFALARSFRGAIRRVSSLLAYIMNVCHIRWFISVCRRRRHAETFAATPARLRYRFPMLAQLPQPPSLHRAPLRSAPLRLDGVKCAPLPTRATDFSFCPYIGYFR